MSELKGIEMETTVQRSKKRTLLEPKLVGQINQHVLNLLLGQRDRGIRRPGGLWRSKKGVGCGGGESQEVSPSARDDRKKVDKEKDGRGRT